VESRLDFYQLFSNFILSESQEITAFSNLTGKGPVLNPLLPSMIKNLCHFMLQSDFSIDDIPGPYSFSYFDNLSNAKLASPDLDIRTTLPHEVFQFMNSSQEEAIFDSEELGATIVSKTSLPTKKTIQGPTALMLSPFFHYAFSNDLWDNQGKWPRFHDRLTVLLNNKSILINSLGPGHYELTSAAKKLENFGIKGLNQNDTYTLILNWNYPLKALIELERLISLEF